VNPALSLSLSLSLYLKSYFSGSYGYTWSFGLPVFSSLLFLSFLSYPKPKGLTLSLKIIIII
jgi:hypothetical protein